jgi:hypothetical protein
MPALTLLLAMLLLVSGCVTFAAFDNGCQGRYEDLCRYYVALEARCHVSSEVPDDDRPVCAARARQAYRDDVQQREQQRMRDVSDQIMRGRAATQRPAPTVTPCRTWYMGGNIAYCLD